VACLWAFHDSQKYLESFLDFIMQNCPLVRLYTEGEREAKKRGCLFNLFTHLSSRWIHSKTVVKQQESILKPCLACIMQKTRDKHEDIHLYQAVET
jgi:hypothetical protein